MPSERVQRQIDRLLDEAEQLLPTGSKSGSERRMSSDWDPDNDDARGFAAAASRSPTAQASSAGPTETSVSPESFALPDSLGNGRYDVRRFLGEGAKQRVYLCHDQPPVSRNVY